MDERKRDARFARWDKVGLERIKADLLSGGHGLVGGTREVRDLAAEWVRMKEAQLKESSREILLLKPSLWGIGIDLKALWQKAIVTLKRQ